MSEKQKHYQPGDVTMIFQDPITQQKKEGLAKLLFHKNSRDGLDYWEVEFLEEPGASYPRFIKT